MPTELTKTDLLVNIANELSNNNAGLINAYDVRHNMEDTVESINSIVSDGDTDTAYSFKNNVRVKDSTSDGTTGVFIAEYGMSYPTGMQVEHYPGPGGISHNALGNLTSGDPHSQYVPIDGTRAMEGNLGLDTYYINSTGGGSSPSGLMFRSGADKEEAVLEGRLVFDDSSTIQTSAGVAKAWVTFDASSGVMTWSGYNVIDVTKISEKFVITFAEGTFVNNDYIPVGYSNARETAADESDFDRHTVGLVSRTGSGTTLDLRKLSFAVLNEAGEYVQNAKINNLVVFGQAPTDNSDYINSGSITVV